MNYRISLFLWLSNILSSWLSFLFQSSSYELLGDSMYFISSTQEHVCLQHTDLNIFELMHNIGLESMLICKLAAWIYNALYSVYVPFSSLILYRIYSILSYL